MTELVDVTDLFVVPETCPRGHQLEPRTVAFDIQTVAIKRQSRRQEATSWQCVPCIREECYAAHTGERAPAEMLHPSNFGRQYRWSASRWWTRVHFASGHQFTDDDPDDEPQKPATRPRKNDDMRYRDPTAVSALSQTDSRPRPDQSTWRDYLDPFELPNESDRTDVEELGLEAWREARAYARYRRHRHGAAA